MATKNKFVGATSETSQDAEFFSFLEGSPVPPSRSAASEVVLEEVPAAVHGALSVEAIVEKAVADLGALASKHKAQKSEISGRVAELVRKVDDEKAALAALAEELAALDKIRARNEAAAKAVEKLAADDSVEVAPKAKKAA